MAQLDKGEERTKEMTPSQRGNASTRPSLTLVNRLRWMPDDTQLHKLKCGLQTGPDFNR